MTVDCDLINILATLPTHLAPKPKALPAGDVSIDEETATSGSQKVCLDHIVTINGSQLLAGRYFMMNKFTGVVSATKDNSNPTAIDLIYEHRNQQLQIAGRLDIDTTGLTITDDVNGITRYSPRTDCKKSIWLSLRTSGDDHQENLSVLLRGGKSAVAFPLLWKN